MPLLKHLNLHLGALQLENFNELAEGQEAQLEEELEEEEELEFHCGLGCGGVFAGHPGSEEPVGGEAPGEEHQAEHKHQKWQPELHCTECIVEY